MKLFPKNEREIVKIDVQQRNEDDTMILNIMALKGVKWKNKD